MGDEQKMNFARLMSDSVYLGMTDCERYGMTWGCDVDCPVLKAGKCELKDSDNKELYLQCLIEHDELDEPEEKAYPQ